MPKVYHSWIASLFDSLLPERCPHCDEPSSRGFCRRCQLVFPAIVDPCRRCGLPRPVLRCPATDRSWALDAVVAPWQYLEPISKLVLQLKFQNRFSIGRAFGLLLGEKLRPRRQRIDFLVPVPLHRQRLRTRSFNQADEIATVLGRTLGLPLFRHAVRRIHSTGTQTTLTLRQRLKNVEHAFQVDARFDGLRLALVDDVITSGATINALARACRAAGATRIEAWAVARTTATGCDSTADATVRGR